MCSNAQSTRTITWQLATKTCSSQISCPNHFASATLSQFSVNPLLQDCVTQKMQCIPYNIGRYAVKQCRSWNSSALHRWSLYVSHATMHQFLPPVLWRCWLGVRKGIRPVKNWVVVYWHAYLTGARCRLAYGPVDVTATHYLSLQ